MGVGVYSFVKSLCIYGGCGFIGVGVVSVKKRKCYIWLVLGGRRSEMRDANEREEDQDEVGCMAEAVPKEAII